MEHRTHIPGSSNGGGGESRAEEWEKNTRVREKGAEIVKHREDRKGGPKGMSQHKSKSSQVWPQPCLTREYTWGSRFPCGPPHPHLPSEGTVLRDLGVSDRVP